VGTVFRDSADAPLNPRMMEFMRRHMRGGFPLVGPATARWSRIPSMPRAQSLRVRSYGARSGRMRASRFASAGRRMSPPTLPTATVGWSAR
jgi:hypothetical protein